jgi:hypothetical protein
MELTTRLELQSQTTRLFGLEAYNFVQRETRLSLSMAVLSSNTCSFTKVTFHPSDYNSAVKQILMMSFSFFTRRY